MTLTIAYGYTDAAAAVGLSADVIKRAVKAGDLPAKKVQRRVLIGATELQAWFDRQPDY